MSRAKPSLGISDDYATMRVGKLRFYYGYEYTVPEQPEENEPYEWAFVVKQGREILTRWSKSEVEKKIEKGSRNDLWGADTYLLAGIGAWMKEKGVDNE